LSISHHSSSSSSFLLGCSSHPTVDVASLLHRVIYPSLASNNSFRPTRPWTSCHHAAAAVDSTCEENWYIFSHSWCEDVYSLVLGSLLTLVVPRGLS
jgi:hypothetical protein